MPLWTWTRRTIGIVEPFVKAFVIDEDGNLRKDNSSALLKGNRVADMPDHGDDLFMGEPGALALGDHHVGLLGRYRGAVFPKCFEYRRDAVSVLGLSLCS